MISAVKKARKELIGTRELFNRTNSMFSWTEKKVFSYLKMSIKIRLGNNLHKTAFQFFFREMQEADVQQKGFFGGRWGVK